MVTGVLHTLFMVCNDEMEGDFSFQETSKNKEGNKTMLKRMQELLRILSKANRAYYLLDDPIMSDHEYDKLYDELTKLEKETGVIYASSPTQRVQGSLSDKLKEYRFSTPMLSADKVHSVDEIMAFSDGKPLSVSWKEDGLTLVLVYEDGKLQHVLTRGTGDVGEDVIHNAPYIRSLPLNIAEKGRLVVRGECVMPWDAYYRYKEKVEENGEVCGHARNITSGAVRKEKPDPVEIQEKALLFKAFRLVEGSEMPQSKTAQLEYLEKLGFDVVENRIVTTREEITDSIEVLFRPENYPIPVDGLIFEFDDTWYGESLGMTRRFARCMKAYKWGNQTHRTKFRGIEFNTTRTGIISMTALFDPIEIDHTTVGRAQIPNVEYFEKYQFGVGDEITVYKANAIIPQIEDNLTRNGSYQLPEHCPCCGAPVKMERVKTSRILRCSNPKCSAKNIQRYVHFCSKERMNLEGISQQMLSKLISHGWVKCFGDLYRISRYRDELMQLPGFGEKSYENLINAVEASRVTQLPNLLAGLGIPNIGRTAGKTISKYFEGDLEAFVVSLCRGYDFTKIPTIGEVLNRSLHQWWADEACRLEFQDLLSELVIQKPEPQSQEPKTLLSGKTVVITGTLSVSRRDMQQWLENAGAKVSSSVSAKTDYLLAGADTGSKLKKAKTLGVTIISEEQAMQMLK